MAKNLDVAIIGRRNTGKSTLFNALIGQRKAIVADIPGVTRDAVAQDWQGIRLMDTPGLDIDLSLYRDQKEQQLEQEILKRTHELVQRLSAAFLLLEMPDVHPFDYELADLLRKQGIPVIVVVNKVDARLSTAELSQFYELGFAEFIPVSAKGRWNLDLLPRKLSLLLREHYQVVWPEEEGEAGDLPSIAIIGRPNVGKSTLLNRLAHEEVAMVSEVPGTTRDTVHTLVRLGERDIRLIDTAGFRKQPKRKEVVERFAFDRTDKALDLTHVVIHVLDGSQGITDTDKKILDLAQKKGKQILFVVNKWDLIRHDYKDASAFWKWQQGKFPILEDYAYMTMSAVQGRNVGKVLPQALELYDRARNYTPTAQLNRILEYVQKDRRFVPIRGKFRFYYLTQVDVLPPTFVFFVNSPDNLKPHVMTYIKRILQKELGLEQCYLRILLRGRQKE